MTLSGLATGIGSLPHKDVDYAIRFLLENFKDDITFWPQMVNLGVIVQPSLIPPFSKGGGGFYKSLSF